MITLSDREKVKAVTKYCKAVMKNCDRSIMGTEVDDALYLVLGNLLKDMNRKIK